jgi:hypothetical protein
VGSVVSGEVEWEKGKGTTGERKKVNELGIRIPTVTQILSLDQHHTIYSVTNIKGSDSNRTVLN